MHPILFYLRLSGKCILFQALLLTNLVSPAHCKPNSIVYDSTHLTTGKQSLSIIKYLQSFYPLQETAEYSITICADIPVNNKPGCVYKKGEPGHVFLILTKRSLVTEEVITKSFGFYPRVPVSCLFKEVRSKIMDNSNREYDVSVEKIISTEEFALILDKSKAFAKKKYNLKKYNCYDYVMEVFNSLSGIEKLPITKVKFPFILGKGGSPCGLYSDLKKLLLNGSPWAPFIKFGLCRSPASDINQTMIASF